MRMGPPWSHDYPRGEMHFMKIIEEITQIQPAHRRLEHPVARRSGAVQLSGRLHGGAGFLDAVRQAGRELPGLPPEGRVRDLRRLPRLRLGQPAGADAPGAARLALDRARRHAPIFHSFFEIDNPLSLAPPYGGLPPSVLGHLRGQRSRPSGSWRSPTSTTTSASTGNGPTPASRRSTYRTKRTSSASTTWCMG